MDSQDGTRLTEALQKLQELTCRGLCHGFFEYGVSCEIIKGGKRQLTIKAGISHKFTIPEGELRGSVDETGDS